VRAIGHVRTFNGSRSVQAFSIRPIHDFNEVGPGSFLGAQPISRGCCTLQGCSNSRGWSYSWDFHAWVGCCSQAWNSGQ
jgi:hypothetical protein